MNTYEINLNNEYLLDLVSGEDSAYKLDKDELLQTDIEYVENFINLEG